MVGTPDPAPLLGLGVTTTTPKRSPFLTLFRNEAFSHHSLADVANEVGFNDFIQILVFSFCQKSDPYPEYGP